MDPTNEEASPIAGPYGIPLVQSYMPSSPIGATVPTPRGQFWSVRHKTASTTTSTPKSPSQRPFSADLRSYGTNADASSRGLAVGSLQAQNIVSNQQFHDIGDLEAPALLGLSPEQAYSYDQPGSLRQVERLENHMKSSENYLNMPSDDRQRALAVDLSNALASMQQTFNRSTDVAADSSRSQGPMTAATSVIPSLGQHGATTGTDHADAESLSSSDDETIDLNPIVSAVRPEDIVQTGSTLQQLTQHQHAHDLATPTDGYSHGKRAASDDDVGTKRRKTSGKKDENLASPCVDNFGVAEGIPTSQPANIIEFGKDIHASAATPSYPITDLAGYTPLGQQNSGRIFMSGHAGPRDSDLRNSETSSPNVKTSPESFEKNGSGSPSLQSSPGTQHKDVSTMPRVESDILAVPEQANNSGVAIGRWTKEEVGLLVRSRREGKSWDEIAQALPRHTRIAIPEKYRKLRKMSSWHQWATLIAPSSSSHAGEAARQPSVTRDASANLGHDDPTSSDTGGRPKRQALTLKPALRPCKVFSKDINGRPYQFMESRSGRLKGCGFLLPGNYMQALFADGMDWVCPIRSCRQPCFTMTTLSEHWRENHRRCLLNDNHDGTFSIKGEYSDELGLEVPWKGDALVISQNPSREDSALELQKRNRVVIPSNQEMATERRAYNEWPDETGKLIYTKGVWLPANYKTMDYPGFEWICPVRSCRRLAQSLHGLSGHFSAAHHATILNDNRDGTFTEMGHYVTRENGQKHRPPMVKSKNPLPIDAPALAEPHVTPSQGHKQKLFAASLAALQSNPHGATQSKNNMTVDEMMANGGYNKGKAPVKDSKRFKSLNEDPISSSSSQSSSPAEEATEKAQAADQDSQHSQDAPESPGTTKLWNSTAEENWATVKSFFTVRKFPPPQKGPIQTLLPCRRERELLKRDPRLKLDITRPKDVALLIVQLVGRKTPIPCSRCEKGQGMFQGCVLMSQEVADALQSGWCSCVNCAWKSQHFKMCGLKRQPREAESAAIVDGVAARRESEARDDEEVHSSRAARRSERLLLAPNEGAERGSAAAAPIQRAASPLRSAIDEKTTPAAEPINTRSCPTENEDGCFTFRAEIIPAGTGLRLSVDTGSVRICTLATGKVTVRLPREPAFRMGLGGMFKLAPGLGAEVVNTSGADAVLHVSSVMVGR